MHCPLTGDTFTFGSLALATTGERSFQEADRDFGSELGRPDGQALEKVRLNVRLRDRLRREEAVARIGQLALEQRDLDAFFEQASRELAHVIGADVVAIQEAVPDERVLVITAGLRAAGGALRRSCL